MKYKIHKSILEEAISLLRKDVKAQHSGVKAASELNKLRENGPGLGIKSEDHGAMEKTQSGIIKRKFEVIKESGVPIAPLGGKMVQQVDKY